MFKSIGKIISDKINVVFGTGLQAKSAQGAIVLGIGTGIERLIRFARNMILARILAPEDFGCMAIILATSSIFEAFSDVGIKQSIVHHKDGAKYEYLNLAWWFQSFRGLILFSIAFVIAPWIGTFYDNPELALFLRVAYSAVIFNGLISPMSHVLQKELRFSRLMIIEQGGAIIGTILAVVLALAIRNMWALVIGFTAEAISRCILSYLLCPFRPKFKVDNNSLHEVLKYVKGMIGISFFTIVSMQFDVFVLGKVMPADQVGMYVLALILSQQPVRMFSRIIGVVLLPMFAKKQHDKKTLCSSFLKINKSIILFGVPFVAFAAIFAHLILLVIYGERYTAVAIPFRIMCVLILIRMLKTILGTMYLALGKPHLHRRFVLLMAVTILVAMYPGVKLFGLIGAACVLMLADLICLVLHISGMPELIGLRIKDYLSCWLPCIWLLPIMLLPIVIVRMIGITSWKIEIMFAVSSLTIGLVAYFKYQLYKETLFLGNMTRQGIQNEIDNNE